MPYVAHNNKTCKRFMAHMDTCHKFTRVDSISEAGNPHLSGMDKRNIHKLELPPKTVIKFSDLEFECKSWEILTIIGEAKNEALERIQYEIRLPPEHPIEATSKSPL